MKADSTTIFVSPEEKVARLINKAWIDRGVLLNAAFALSPRETYLSVNRLSVESYNKDVKTFIEKHSDYQLAEKPGSYRRALLIVEQINRIEVVNDNDILDVKVEVEPRSKHTKSHAGIFVRAKGQNVVRGRELSPDTLPAGVSSDAVLQELRWQLYDIAEMQLCELTDD